jgi:3-oxoacyl-[acyl-carrier protein] reductase|tara:strand:- start:1405 stop:2214 length:810 start_codon:yes stop_codon:yes gene_type:complete
MEKELKGKVAIVTGAGRLRGIGKTTAVALAKLGANVVVTGTGRKPENYPDDEKAVGWKDIESVADLIRAEGSKALTIIADVTNKSDVKNMIDQTIKEFGRIDILINNAAYARAEDRVPILDLDENVFQKVVDIKLTGTFLCTKGAIEHMIKQGDGGKIVNISSSAGKKGTANFLAYNAGNFGVVGMTQSMARELGSKNINVNAVCPGAVDTSRMDVVRDDWDRMAADTPIGRNGTDEEVGNFCAYLCTEASSWIHGQSINLNGGTIMEH